MTKLHSIQSDTASVISEFARNQYRCFVDLSLEYVDDSNGAVPLYLYSSRGLKDVHPQVIQITNSIGLPRKCSVHSRSSLSSCIYRILQKIRPTKMSKTLQPRAGGAYPYTVSEPAAIIFSVLFGISALVAAFQIIRARAWIWTVMLLAVSGKKLPFA